MPHVLITGATGFLGRTVTGLFLKDGWTVSALSRDPVAARAKLPSRVGTLALEDLDSDRTRRFDTVVHLAGESVAGGLWTPKRKQKLMDSRVKLTRRLMDALARLETPPAAFVAASGLGYYGARGADVVRASDLPGNDFLGQMAAAWERESFTAEKFGARTVVIRMGMVLGADGGPLPAMLLPFRFGLGAVLGSGTQYWPWIHRDDAAALFVRAATDAALSGPLHGAAGAPLTNREFSKELVVALRRPLFLRVPAWALRLATGELADLFLHGQRVQPDARFEFRHNTLSSALAASLRAVPSA